MQMKQWHNFFGKKSQSYSGKDEKEKLIKGEIGCKKGISLLPWNVNQRKDGFQEGRRKLEKWRRKIISSSH